MLATLAELLPELLSILFYAVGAAGLAAAGVEMERYGLETLSAGHPLLGAWVMFMGAMAFFFGPYGMGYRNLLPRLRALNE